MTNHRHGFLHPVPGSRRCRGRKRRTIHRTYSWPSSHFRQLVEAASAAAARFRVGEIVTTDAGIQPFHSVGGSGRKSGSSAAERQTAGKCCNPARQTRSAVFDLPRAGQHSSSALSGMLAERGADERWSRILYALDSRLSISCGTLSPIKSAPEDFENIQPGGSPRNYSTFVGLPVR